jgi:hypothetical protein
MATAVNAIGARGLAARRAAVCAALALALGLPLLPQASFAGTVSVTGGGLDAGALCALGAICPSNPSNGFAYTSGGAVTGTLDYNGATDTADFIFTLSANTFFGTEELMAGSTFSATAIPVTIAAGTHGTETIALGSPPVNGTTSNVNFISPTLSVIENNPSLSALACTLSGTGGQCGVSLGSVNGAGNALELVDPSNNEYNAYLTFNVNVIPVPLPAGLPLLLSGLIGFGAMARRYKVAAA